MALDKFKLNIKENASKIILVSIFVMTFLFGWILGHQDARFGQIGFTPNLVGKNSSQNVDFSIFWRAWDLLQKNYDGQLNFQNMVYGAVRGMVQAVGDPYTNFLTADDAKQLEEDLSGTISGIGAEVGIKNNHVIVISPIADSPADKAGLMAGDIILYIDGVSTEGMDINTAVSKIRGEAGTKVKLVIERNGREKTYDIVREKITVASVKSEIKNGNIGYVEISRFDDATTNELRNAIDEFNSKNIKKVIIDLRDDPGGYFDQSISVSSEFIKSGIVVTEKKAIDPSDKTDYKASGKGKMTSSDVKIIVLINGGTASAAEIVAGALKDTGRAIIVGEKSFGKGSVQEIEDLPGGAKLKVTVAHWYTPNGQNIGKEGIMPDYVVKLTQSDIDAGKDPQLTKAIELLK